MPIHSFEATGSVSSEEFARPKVVEAALSTDIKRLDQERAITTRACPMRMRKVPTGASSHASCCTSIREPDRAWQAFESHLGAKWNDKGTKDGYWHLLRRGWPPRA
jgi:hypothetical protein